MAWESFCEKWGRVFTLAALISLFAYWGVVKTYIVRPFEALIAIAAILTLLHIRRRGHQKESGHLAFWAVFFAIFTLLLLAGFLRSVDIYGISDTTILATIKDFYLFGGAALGFLLMTYYGRERNFRKNAVYAFLTPIIFIPLIFIPATRELFTFESFIIGIHQVTTVFASFTFTALACLLVFFIKERRAAKKLMYWVIIAALLSLILWTGSRAGLLATGLALLFIIAAEINTRGRRGALKFAALSCVIATITLVVSFSILPYKTKIAAVSRLFPQILNYAQNPLSVKLSGALAAIIENPIPSAPAQSREEIWPRSINLFLEQPLGLGPDYWRNSGVISQEGRPTKAHNSILEAANAGGIGGLALFLFFLAAVGKAIFYSRNKDAEWLMLSAAFIGLFVITFFNGAMQGLPWFWIVAGLLAAKELSPLKN